MTEIVVFNTTDMPDLPGFHSTIGPKPDPAAYLAITKARLISRYRMHTIPGRPEELETNGDAKRVISLAYCGGEMRIRKHGGKGNREWGEVRDFRLHDGWLMQVYDYLDTFFGYVTPMVIRKPIDPLIGNGDSPYFQD